MSEEAANNQAFSVTLKAGKGYDAPWIVIQGESASEVHDRVVAVAESGLGATVGQAAKAFSAAYEFGHKLGAEPLNPPAEEKKEAPAKKAPTKKAPAKKAAPEEEAPEEVEAPAEEAVEESAPKKPAAARTKPPAKKWRRA